MTFIASYPLRKFAEMAVNALNDRAPPGAPRFEVSEQPGAHHGYNFHVSADRSLDPSQVQDYRQFIRGLPFGSKARY